MDKTRKIEKQLEVLDDHLANAEEYVAQDVNIKSAPGQHFGDWKGKSGHPLWMKNKMIPTIKKAQVKLDKALEKIKKKDKDKRRRQ